MSNDIREKIHPPQLRTPQLIVKEEEAVRRVRDTYAEKHPMVFALAGTFGLVSTFYGFEKLIDRIELFNNNPWILLATGVITLLITGAFYKKLS